MEYLQTPLFIKKQSISNKDYSLSPINYQIVRCKNKNIEYIKTLIDEDNTFVGKEIGEQSYRDFNTGYKYIRTRSIQGFSNLLVNEEDIIFIIPSSFKDYNLFNGDILFVKDTNIGDVAIFHNFYNKKYSFNSGIMKLTFKENKYYIYAFLKSNFIKSQLKVLIPKGATIKHSKKKIMECFIPFPKEKNIIEYISILTEDMINKEIEIYKRNKEIDFEIDKELKENQKKNNFIFHFPKNKELKNEKRLDIGIYCKNFKKILYLIKNYKGGYFENIFDMGFDMHRGQNLQISCIGDSIISEIGNGYMYKLIRNEELGNKKNIGEIKFLGNINKNLMAIKKGEIMFSSEGNIGNVMIFCDEISNTISNIHGRFIYKKDEISLKESVFLGCFLNYLKGLDFYNNLRVGGQGGSLTDNHFYKIAIPKFKEEIKNKILKLYYNPIKKEDFNLVCYLKKEFKRNKELGLFQLNIEYLNLKDKINSLINRVILDKNIKIE